MREIVDKYFPDNWVSGVTVTPGPDFDMVLLSAHVYIAGVSDII